MVHARATVLLGTLILAACIETPTRPVGDPVAVELGPVIRLLDVPTSHEFVQVLLEDGGLAHVFVASPKAKTLRHVVVDQAGAISLDEVVQREFKPQSLDAAFDASGRLHILAGQQHYVRASDGQWSAAPTPWGTAGLDTFGPRFVHGAGADQPLLYAFNVRGKEVDAPARWDVYGFGGGFGAALILPWRTRGSRLAVVADDGGDFDLWSVIDLDENEDVADWVTVAEPGGRVHVLYDAQRTALAQMSMARYAHIEPEGADDVSPVREIAGHHVRAVPGVEVPVSPERPAIGLSAAVGYSPVTGELLLVRPHLGGRVLRDGAWGPEVLFPLELAWEPRVAARATQRFDVVITGTRSDSGSNNDRPVFYLQFRAGRWSAPVEVAGAEVDTLFGWTWDAVQIASDGHERVFVTWPVPNGIEARWLRVPTD